MKIQIINPNNKKKLTVSDEALVDDEGNAFPVVNGVPRIAEMENYTENFGVQWNKFDQTQLDREQAGLDLSRERFFTETRWDSKSLANENVLEVGSGAGRFSKVLLEHTECNLYSVDYSDAVTANYRNNGGVAPDRFHLFQASVYAMPFPEKSFDKVFCLGVLQHTPDFELSVKSLIGKARVGGEIVVDFYPIRGWWTKLHAKYLLRPITKKMPNQKLLALIENNIDWLMKAYFALHKMKLGVLSRFLPICDIKGSFPSGLTPAELREWAILDTFDMYSPQHDHPQRVSDVARMFEDHGARVTFAGFEEFAHGYKAAVVRGVREHD